MSESENPEAGNTPAESTAPAAAQTSMVEQLNIEPTHVVDVGPTVKLIEESPEQSTSSENVGTPDWFYADGVNGTGEKPSWFNDQTFNTIEDQAKAQNEARKKLGGFTGPPDEGYELGPLGDNEEIAFDENDPFLTRFAETAQDMKMSQDGFNQMLNMYANEVKQIEIEEKEETEQFWKDELQKLGPDGVEELKILKQWSRNALPEELHEKFDDMVTSADVVNVFKTLIDRTVPTQLTHVAPGTGINRFQLRDMMKDPKYGRDDEFTRHVDSEAEALYGRTKIYD